MIRNSYLLGFGLIAVIAAPALGQMSSTPLISARLPQQMAQTRTLTLPANTEFVVRLNNELSTKQNKEGDPFTLSVAQDVMRDGYVIIPRGSKAIGEITWMTGKGAFGKSGKMDIEVKYAEVSGQRIPLVGKFRQEGEGNTVATVGAIALVWVAAPFITGKTGRIPAGRELTVFTRDDLTVGLPEVGPISVITATVSSPVQSTASPTGSKP